MQQPSKYLQWASLLTFWLFSSGAAVAVPLQVTLESNAVKASGVAPKGRIVLLGVTREIGPDDFPEVRRHLQVLTDEDGDGAVRYPLEAGVPVRSVWAVVDLASGDSDTTAPAALGSRRVNWRGRGLVRRPDGRDAVEDRRSLVELLVVRPTVGAWSLRVGDGGESDGDGKIDGRLQGILENMKPLADGPQSPAEFQADDVVLAIDPSALEITLVKVPKKLEEK